LHLFPVLGDIRYDVEGRELERNSGQHRFAYSDGLCLWRLDTCSRDHAGGGINK
jgi:hypothetical protein